MPDGETGYLIRATALEDRVRAFAIDASAVVAELQLRQATEPAATAALGRTATAALLLASMIKQQPATVSLRIDGGGPGGPLLATATPDGDVRGFIANPRPDVEQVRNGKLNVSGVVGKHGRFSVVRDLGVRFPYSSSVEMVSGEIGEDLAYYLAQSEQIPSAVGIGVFVRADGSVEAAGGYMVQLLPGLGEPEIAELEETLRALPHPTTMLREGDTPEAILDRIFAQHFTVLGRTSVRFRCPCSRDRAGRALAALGHQELNEIEKESRGRGYAELVCEFCGDIYRFTPHEVSAILDGLA
jgi:molecular chaperone Hsp33